MKPSLVSSRLTLRQHALLLAAWVCLPLAALCAYQTWVSYRHEVAQVRSEIRFWRELLAEHLTTFCDETRGSLGRFAEQAPSERRLLQALAEQLSASRREYRSVYVLDQSGRVVVNTESSSDSGRGAHPWVARALAAQAFEVGPMFSSASNQWSVPFFQPMRTAAGVRTGTLVLLCDPTRFNSLLLTRSLEKDGIVMVLEEGGNVLLHTKPDHVGQNCPQYAEFFRHYDAGQEEGEALSWNGLTRLYSSVRIAGTPWLMRASRGKAETLALLARKLSWGLGLLGIGLVTAMLLAIRFAALLSRPAVALAGAALEQAAGRSVAPLTDTGPVEVAATARAFNHMIIQQRAAEQQLKVSEEKYRLLVENAAETILVAQGDRLVYSNPAAEQLFGYSGQELSARPFLEFIHPDDRALVGQRYADRQRGLNPPSEYSFRFISSAGRVVWVELKAVRITWKGQPATLNFLSDVTERRQAESAREALLNLETQLSAATTPRDAARCIFAAADQLWAWDSGTLDLYWPEEDRVDAVIYYDLVQGERREIQLAEASGPPTPGIRRVLEQGAELILREAPCAPPPDVVMFGDVQRPSASLMRVPIQCQDRLVGVMSVQSYTVNAFTKEDLRLLQGLADHCGGALERLRAADALQASEGRYKLLLESAPDAVFLLEAEGPGAGRILAANSAAAAMHGYSREELLQMRSADLDVPEAVEEATARFRRLLAGENLSFEIAHRRKDGTAFPVEVKALLTTLNQRKCVLAFERDITERKRAEAEQERLRAQLQQAQKMDALGTLAGGIAHDFNNILGAILGNVELARLELEANHPAGLSLNEIKQAGRRARDLVQRILAFSRPQEPIRQAISLQPVVEEVLKLLRSTLPATVQLTHEARPDTPPVLADASQVHQVIMNLATNGWHALEDRPGCIQIKLAPCRIETAPTLRTVPKLGPGFYARLSVSDTGKGMDQLTVERVFEPFFTTKAVGKGTGLGLSVVHGIMKAHQGAVAVESQPGDGATFHLFFPAAPVGHNPPGAALGSATTLALQGTGQRILLLDDEPSMVLLVERLLGKLGYRVNSHTSPATALAAFNAEPEAFDLIITDLSMPGMSGLELARAVLTRRPEAPVVLASGHLPPEELEQARKLGIRDVILKPNTAEELGPLVQRLLSH